MIKIKNYIMYKSSKAAHALNIILLSSFVAFSCMPEERNPIQVEEAVKSAIFESMQEWYFWNNELPASINVSNFSSNQALLDALTFKPLDRWSYLTTREAFNQAFTGQNSGHGFGWGFDEQERLFLTFVFDEAPAGIDGWQRGWQVLEINDQPITSYRTPNGYNFQLGPNETGISNKFKFLLPDGSETTRVNAKATYQSNSVLFKDTYEMTGKKVGYWVYQSFKATAGLTPTRSQEVEESFTFFQQNGIDELIIDLRYNGGGSVAVTEQILNYLIPASHNNKVMYTNKYNSDKSNFNTNVNFSKKGSLNLSRIVLITSRGSASASELLINSLTPYMDLFLIGDNTYGKPVGSFPLSRYHKTLEENNVELVPITFATANADGRAEFFDGFPANALVSDDPAKNWGDISERRLKAALEYIETGSVNSRMRQEFYRPRWELIDAFSGLQKEFPAF
ncbi:S41 family peptidase [Pararhodonellum marinum]|uniref:S41 family peptidase n=1 Tax=Pararhodonellum marinum TaxID=2755358 RepID=UPI001E2EB375|nr:S41 family peptidase [Pararhodonellum marinum]